MLSRHERLCSMTDAMSEVYGPTHFIEEPTDFELSKVGGDFRDSEDVGKFPDFWVEEYIFLVEACFDQPRLKMATHLDKPSVEDTSQPIFFGRKSPGGHNNPSNRSW